jgi:cytochrome P450
MSSWPLLGSLPAFRADSTGFLLRQAQQQGDVARFRLGRRPAFLLNHPNLVRAVLVDQATAFEKGRLIQRARRLLGDGLLTSEGAFHAMQRRRIRPVFTQHRLHGYGEGVAELTRRHTERWRPGARIRVDVEMDALAMRVVAQALLGADIGSEIPELGHALRRLARWAPLLAAPGGRMLEKVGPWRKAIETIEAAITQRIERPGPDDTLVGALHRAGDDGQPMPSRLVRDEVMTVFLAGHDTTAASLMWIWLLLGQDPRAEAQLHEELQTVLGGRDPAAADVGRLHYTDMIVREALRLYPPISRIGRRPMTDVDLGSVVLPRGATVFVSPFVTQRDPRWFPDPGAFQPERWRDPEALPRFAWFPFGAGPRACIGEHFARLVLVLAVATIAQRWRLQPTRAGLPRPRSLLTLKPRGRISMELTRRACGP